MSSWRQQFPYFQAAQGPAAFLDSAASAQKPAVVLQAMDEFATTRYANIHRGAHALAEAASADFEAARTVVARFIGARSPQEIIFTSGTTAGIHLVASSLWLGGLVPLGAGIVVTALEHHANYLPWQRLAHQVGGEVHVVPLTPHGQIDLQAMQSILEKEKIFLVAVSHVSNVLGSILPVQAITQLAHRHGALVMVDGAQAIAHLPVDVTELDADFYAFSAHKLYGPTGLGVLYLRAQLGHRMPPCMLGGGMVHRVGRDFGDTTWAPMPHKFEAGTPPIIQAVGLSSAIHFIQGIGWPALQAHHHELASYLLQQLAQVSDIRLLPAAAQRVGVVSFVLGQAHPHDVGSILSASGVSVRVGHHCAQPLMEALGLMGCVRASLGLYNTREDIDALIAGLHRAAQKLL